MKDQLLSKETIEKMNIAYNSKNTKRYMQIVRRIRRRFK